MLAFVGCDYERCLGRIFLNRFSLLSCMLGFVYIYIYIYIKPNPLKLPQFSTSPLFYFSFYFRFYILYIFYFLKQNYSLLNPTTRPYARNLKTKNPRPFVLWFSFFLLYFGTNSKPNTTSFYLT